MNQAQVGRRPGPRLAGAAGGHGNGAGTGLAGPGRRGGPAGPAGHDRGRDGCGGRCQCDSRVSGNRYGPAI